MRKSETVVVPPRAGSRDAGKQFLITEMPAARAEKWAMRMFIALKGTAGEISMQVASLGTVGVGIAGLNAFLRADVKPEALEPLMDEMMTCVRMIRDPRAVDRTTGGPVATDIVSDDDIEEVHTRAWLRSEVLRVHTGFSAAEAFSKFLEAIQTPPPAS